MELTKSDIKAIARSQYREKNNVERNLLLLLFGALAIGAILAKLLPDPYGVISIIVIFGFAGWKMMKIQSGEEKYVKLFDNWELSNMLSPTLEKINKNDVSAVARKRFAKSLNKKNLIVCMVLLIFVIPCVFLPEPYDTIGLIIFVLPIFIYIVAITIKEDRFAKDFVKRWESGEITFDGVKQ